MRPSVTYNDDKRCHYDTGLYNSVLYVQPFATDETEPVTLAQAKAWGKIENDEDDDIITALITAARRICENFSGIGFINREITAGINNSNGGFFLPYGPVTNEPTAVDANTDEVSLTYNIGQLESPTGRMVVTYQAGYEVLPEDLMTALKAQFLFLYENRGEGTQSVSPISKMILEPLRMVV